MIPKQRQLVARLKDKPFTLLGINSDRDLSGLSDKLKESGVSWPQLYEGTDRAVSRQWNVMGYPTIYILDHEGVIRKRGFLPEEEIERTVDELLAKVASE
ncbi:MAG: TlpA family protein disulfide reductase [Planctomycetota bacterium]|jgi:hypothetical protein